MIAHELKEKLRSRQTQIGTFVKLADPTALEVLGLAGMDFAIIDTEHAPCDQMLLLDMIRAADSVGLPTIVRVPEGTEPHILKALDLGASGVQIPGLSTPEEIDEAISFTKYAPRGVRGLSFAQRSAGYGTQEKFHYMQMSNDGLINVVHIENKKAADCTAQLCDREDIDVLFIGPMDISQSLGHPGDPGHVLQFPLQLSVFLLQCFYRLGQRVDEFRNFRSSICSFLICCGHEFSSGNGFIIIRKYPEDRRHFSSRHFPQDGPVQQYPPDTVRRRPVAPACSTKCGGSTRAGGTR